MAMEIVLLLVFSLLVITPRAAGIAVLDSAGDEVRTGLFYYVKPSVSIPGRGGLGLVAQNDLCPLLVTQVPFINPPLEKPVAFFPVNPKEHTVQEGSTLNAKFLQPTQCPESTVWKLDGATGYVTTGGTTSDPFSRFAIRKVAEEPYYQIDFCPVTAAACAGTLGLASDSILSIRAASPHTIYFEKVKQPETSMIRSAIVRPN